MSEDRYPFEDFSIDLDALREDGTLHEGPLEQYLGWSRWYFKQRYGDMPSHEIGWRMFLFLEIYNFLGKHFNEFDQKDYAVYGSKAVGGMVADHLLMGIHHAFSKRKLGEFDSVTPEEVMEYAEGFRE